jgi:hypothetical protein
MERPNAKHCDGCQFDQHVAADQKFDGGEFSSAFDYGDSPDHTCYVVRCESGWTGDRCTKPLGHRGFHSNH